MAIIHTQWQSQSYLFINTPERKLSHKHHDAFYLKNKKDNQMLKTQTKVEKHGKEKKQTAENEFQ